MDLRAGNDDVWLAQSENMGADFSNFFTKTPLRTAECECVFPGIHSITPFEILKLKNFPKALCYILKIHMAFWILQHNIFSNLKQHFQLPSPAETDQLFTNPTSFSWAQRSLIHEPFLQSVAQGQLIQVPGNGMWVAVMSPSSRTGHKTAYNVTHAFSFSSSDHGSQVFSMIGTQDAKSQDPGVCIWGRGPTVWDFVTRTRNKLHYVTSLRLQGQFVIAAIVLVLTNMRTIFWCQLFSSRCRFLGLILKMD